MGLQDFFSGLDNLFAQKQLATAESYLSNHLELAKNAADTNYQLAVLNEQVGYYRSLGRFTESLLAGSQAMEIVSAPDFTLSTSAATTMLNVATALRAAGQAVEALELYKKVDQIYANNLEGGDRRRAALYNNMAQAMVATGNLKTALEYLHESLDILKISESNYAELATNHTNIAALYISLKNTEQAEPHLREAMEIFEALGYDDAHYPAALSAMAQLMYIKGEYSSAVDYYRLALNKTESIFGENIDYARICRNCAKVYSLLGMPKEAEGLTQKAQVVENKLNSLNAQTGKGNSDERS